MFVLSAGSTVELDNCDIGNCQGLTAAIMHASGGSSAKFKFCSFVSNESINGAAFVGDSYSSMEFESNIFNSI